MIHYTPFPAEWFFMDPTQQIECYTIEWHGVPMVVQWDQQQGAATIMQLLSLDPQHYLDPRFQPGNKLAIFPNE